MPRAKRSPIEYTPQFGAGIFRPKETIDQELAELEADASVAAAGTLGEADVAPVVAVTHEPRTANRSTRPPAASARTNGGTNERTNEGLSDRSRVRHSFDVWQDQLLSLSEIQAERFSRTGRKPKIGELVQEALDAYIARERKRTNGRTNER
jgi:hypothetical protein